MAQIAITKLEPPYPQGRIHVYVAEKRCRLYKIKVEFDSIEAEKYAIVIQRQGQRDKETGAFIQDNVTEQSSFELNQGDKALFMLTSTPYGIASVNVSYSVGNPKKTGSNKA